MAQWFECKVTYDSAFSAEEDPKNARKKETYLVDALSFTEAEARIIKEITPFVVGEMEVTAVKKAKITEMVYNDDPSADKWYRAKVMYITLDNDMEKKVATTYMVKADSFPGALKHLTEVGMKGMMGEWEIAMMAETPIMEVYRYEAPAEENKED